MEELKVGEKVMAIDQNGRTVLSEVTMFLHKNTNTTSEHHLKLSTENGKTVTLTQLHLIWVATDEQYIFAKDVQVGQLIAVYDACQDHLRRSRVTRIEELPKRGMYAPLTAVGTLLVNDVHVSCYASFQSHRVSHAVVWMWGKLSAHFDWLNNEQRDESGILWFPRYLLSFATALRIV